MYDENNPTDFRRYERMPIYQKAMDIVQIVDSICALIPEDDPILKDIKGFMMADSYVIPAKIAGAEGGDLYDIRMENATLIRKAARELVVQTNGLAIHGFEEPEYFKLLRQEIEEFRLLFKDWISTFDPLNYIMDRWGLFNPPGMELQDDESETEEPPPGSF